MTENTPRHGIFRSFVDFLRLTKYRWDFARNYLSAFGLVGAIRLLHLMHMSGREKGEIIEIRHPALVAPLFLRFGTSDISVFESIFVWRQYALKFATPPKTILDGGGNIGLSVVWFSTHFPDAEILVVEPNAANYELLLQNMATFRNVKTLQAGIWSRDCLVRVKQEDVRPDSFSFEPCEAGQDGATQAFDIATLADRFVMPTLDLVKLDIEGAEEELFTNRFESWLHMANMIVVECHSAPIRETVRKALRAPEWRESQCGENDVFVRATNATTANV